MKIGQSHILRVRSSAIFIARPHKQLIHAALQTEPTESGVKRKGKSGVDFSGLPQRILIQSLDKDTHAGDSTHVMHTLCVAHAFLIWWDTP